MKLPLLPFVFTFYRIYTVLAGHDSRKTRTHPTLSPRLSHQALFVHTGVALVCSAFEVCLYILRPRALVSCILGSIGLDVPQ